jgi:hypothetical protein
MSACLRWSGEALKRKGIERVPAASKPLVRSPDLSPMIGIKGL